MVGSHFRDIKSTSTPLAMKSTLLTLIALALLALMGASAQELTIVEQDWELAKTKAKAENKLVLIDFYTTWCGPCKKFTKAVAEDAAFSQGIAQQFVLLKYDAEKDLPHGLTRKYYVRSYPTYITVTPDGQTLAKQYGRFQPTEASKANFLNFLAEAGTRYNNQQYLTGHNNRFDLEYPEFYTKLIDRVQRPKRSTVAAWWEDNGMPTNEVGFAVLVYLGGTDAVNNYFIEHRDEFIRLYGAPDANKVVRAIASDRFDKSVAEQSEAGFQAAKTFAMENMNPKKEAESMVHYFQGQYYLAGKQWEAYGQWLASDVEAGQLSAMEINYHCWNLVEKCEDIALLEKAVVWMQEVVNAAPEYAYIDTYAWLLYKAGQKEAARRAIVEAIAVGKADGENVSESENLLALINENLP